MKKLASLLLLLIPICLNAQLKINEIMPNNVSAVMDDTKNYSMWVELYNPIGNVQRNQNIYYFTDTKSEPKKWKPASKVIPAGGFSLLWFDRGEYTGHSSFKLEPGGGKLFLMDIGGNVVDSVKYPAQYRNISYGRKTDGDPEWVFFEQQSSNASNNGKIWSNERCGKPVFGLSPGFYTETQYLSFKESAPKDTIFYTLNGAEPTHTSTYYVPGSRYPISTTKVVRAKAFSKDKLSSDIVTGTYFINVRDPHLTIVSIVTNPANLKDPSIGIYTAGNYTNYNQDWKRAANFELFDTTKTSCVNQEIDISTCGAYSRSFDEKPLRLSPAKKFGDDQFHYDFFKASKPGMKYKEVRLRNSGNDFFYSMMRDAFNQALVLHRMDVDVQAYEPVVQYINGEYYGLINLREVSSKDFMYSNFGIDNEDIVEIGIDRNNNQWYHTDPSYTPLSNYITDNDITKPEVYNKVCEMMDMEEFINYHITEILIGNWDWPWNNVKIWKKTVNGKWRWIMYDTDWTFNYSENNNENFNTLQYVLGENPETQPDAWSNLLMRRLILNPEFQKKFVDRFCVQVSTTFTTKRINAVMDSLSSKISAEIILHKAKWGGSARTLVQDLVLMKRYSAARPRNMMNFLSGRFADSAKVQSVQISSNVPGTTYMMNDEYVMDSELSLKYFNGSQMNLKANPVFGYEFKHWEVTGSPNLNLINMGDTWKYFDGNAIPATNWNQVAYSDAAWKSGPALFGWGETGVVTTISFGDNASDKYPTSYFRKTINIDNLAARDNFNLRMLVDDGAVIYINGQELERYNMPVGPITFNTFTTSNLPDAQYVNVVVPKTMLKEGDNLISVEVHQVNATTSDMIFDMDLTCTMSIISNIVTDPIYSAKLGSDMTLKAIFEESTPVEDTKPSIVINEIVSSNDMIRDEFGEKDDYIELYNTGDKDVNIAGLFMTDTPVNPTLVEIAATDAAKTTVPAHGRLILWADNEPEQGLLHMAFKLGKEGETIVLSRKNKLGQIETIDAVTYPLMEANLSYSRRPDGSANWVLQDPTFNFTNDNAIAVEEVAKSSIDLYPTLVSESFSVRNASGLLLTVTDLTGKVVYKGSCASDVETISASSLKSGMYLVTVGRDRFKIIKR